MFIRKKASAPKVRQKNDETTHELLGNAEHISSNLSIAHVEVEPFQKALLHSHDHTEEAFYILAGSGEAICDDKKQQVQAGDCIYVPKGCRHQLINTGSVKLVYLAICTPAWVRHSGVS